MENRNNDDARKRAGEKPQDHAKPRSGERKRVGLAFQGGSFLAGAVDAGVVRALIEKRVFDPENPDTPFEAAAFSGTSAGALVAAVCWSQSLQNAFPDTAEILTKLWLHNANSFIPTQEWGDFWKGFDNAARSNPLYDLAVETFRTPWIHAQFRDWVQTYIHTSRAMEALYGLRDAPTRPRLALGAADILQGEIITFGDDDFLKELKELVGAPSLTNAQAFDVVGQFMLDALMASGSLDEINGTTTITSGAHKGTYLDGAWGQNPPVEPMTDFGLDEIWIVEIFPKFRQRLPRSHPEREDRKEELWQNSLVEQQVHMIRKVNAWLADKKLVGTHHRHIEVRRLPMTLDFTPGARIVNAPSFLNDMMDYGHENALHFLKGVSL